MVDIFQQDAADVRDQLRLQSEDFHVYERAFIAKTPAPGSQLVWDTAGEHAKYQIGLAKARALDKAREDLIRASLARAVDILGGSYVQPTYVSRSVDGVEGAPDSAIML